MPETVDEAATAALETPRYREHVAQYGAFDVLPYHETWEWVTMLRMRWDDQQDEPYFTEWDVMRGDRGEDIYREDIVTGEGVIAEKIGSRIPDPECVADQHMRCDWAEATPDVVASGIETMYSADVATRQRHEQISAYASELREYLIEEQDTDPADLDMATTHDLVFKTRPYDEIAEQRDALHDLVFDR